ncbi:MAG: PEGA domain-containing protein [Gammaproteobacteria bacterium]
MSGGDREPATGGAEPIVPIAFEPLAAPQRRARVRLRPLRIAGALVIAAALGAVWFVTVARTVVIEWAPADAQVQATIRGGFALALAGRHLMRAGEYRIQAHAPGFEPFQAALTVDEAAVQTRRFTLVPLPGHLRVQAAPVAAAVMVDGVRRATTPATVRDLPAGTHRIRVEAPRYRPYEASVAIAGRGRTQALAVKLEPAWAPVSVSSEPPGAELSVDGVVAGNTPLTAEILEGASTLELHAKGRKAWQQVVQVVAGQPLTLPAVVMAPADVTLDVASSPAGASVTVGGVYRGRTPLTVAFAPVDSVEISVYKEGYATVRRRVPIERDAQRIDIALAAELGEVVFNANPADAELFVDGAARGSATQTLQLPVGKRAIEIRRAGFVTYRANVSPRTGVTQRVDAQLVTAQEARQAAMKPEIRTGAGQVLRLQRPDRFTMGASRREPGRRANEVLHEVVLGRAFYVGVKEITNAEYRQFDPKHGSGRVQEKSLDGENQPVVGISWDAAARYCNWLSAKEDLAPFYKVEADRVVGFDPSSTGYRLPSEAEWEWLARVGADGRTRKFPWGEAFPPPSGAGNFADKVAELLVGRTLPGYNDGFGVTAPVGSFAADARGLFDLAGNAAEWAHDFYDVPAAGAPATDPLGPVQGEHHVIRGASWAHGSVTELRASFRDYGNAPRNDLGFRIARYAE